ncbi:MULTISPECIES: hypothetical protein [unclassified Moorena]|uniref:hypothetical protein n=1 Tax=unclassified Moorena TaxID=2683338 RepID=UPI0013FF46C4|nr:MULTISPECIES: hypothetical protein [unclassified Moorena]NEO16942.1 hypothetical protein [Moorena sp. SIO3E8]NEO74936.1 hypothetical protein [Moorena sp. SIO4G3]NEQ04313.1 hypothetical protein [Moorena sp. SIO3F7]
MKFKLGTATLCISGAVFAMSLVNPSFAKIPDFLGNGANSNSATVPELEQKSSFDQTSSPDLVAQAVAISLTGTWRANDGGTYYIRQVGNELWWYGQSSNNGRSFSNVFHGYIGQNEVAGNWADVPRGRTRGSGEMVVRIDSNRRLTAVRRTGGFSGSVWTR